MNRPWEQLNNQPFNSKTMSERSKLNRKRREEKEEKQGNRVIMWIAVVLISGSTVHDMVNDTLKAILS